MKVADAAITVIISPQIIVTTVRTLRKHDSSIDQPLNPLDRYLTVPTLVTMKCGFVLKVCSVLNSRLGTGTIMRLWATPSYTTGAKNRVVESRGQAKTSRPIFRAGRVPVWGVSRLETDQTHWSRLPWAVLPNPRQQFTLRHPAPKHLHKLV